MNPLKTFENLLQEMKLNVTKGGINYIQRHTLKDRFTEVGKFDNFVFVPVNAGFCQYDKNTLQNTIS